MVQPALRFPPELLVRAQGAGLGVKVALFDVDGVLTDGSVFIGEQGEVFKAFSTLDGHGLKLLAQAGADLLAELRQLLDGEGLEILRRVDPIEQASHACAPFS